MNNSTFDRSSLRLPERVKGLRQLDWEFSVDWLSVCRSKNSFLEVGCG